MTDQAWKLEGSGPRWVPVLAQTEVDCSLPTDLLCRIAYQESTFIEAVIRGIKPSPVGAMGMMQLMPRYFASVRISPPFTDNEVEEQISEAADFLVALQRSTHDWRLTVAAYNAGLGAVEKAGWKVPDFPETQNYVAAITRDVPAIDAGSA